MNSIVTYFNHNEDLRLDNDYNMHFLRTANKKKRRERKDAIIEKIRIFLFVMTMCKIVCKDDSN
jgi:hypothetical protein